MRTGCEVAITFECSDVSNVSEVGTAGVHNYVMDSDASSFYPSTMISLNTFIDKLLIRFKDEVKYRDLIEDKLEFARKYLSMPSKQKIWDEI